MMHPDKIKELILAGMTCEHLALDGDGQHFEAIVVSAEFAGKSRVQRQQMVNALLKPYFDSGELHSLQMQTMTPDEWSAARG